MMAAVVLAITSSTACGTFGNITRAAADALLPVSEENKLGEQLAAQVEQKAKLVKDPEIAQYVARIGAKVAAKASPQIPKGIKMTYKVIDDP